MNRGAIQIKRDLCGNVIKISASADNSQKSPKRPENGDDKARGVGSTMMTFEVGYAACSAVQGPKKEEVALAKKPGTITQEEIIVEILRFGGTIKLKEIMKKFRKRIKGKNQKANKERFTEILKNVARAEKDPVDDATILILKSQFSSFSRLR